MPKFQDLTGKTFGLLTATERVETGKRGTHWRCKCACGQGEKIILAATLTWMEKDRPMGLHCGCVNRHEFKDLSGERFSRLLVLRRGPDHRSPSQSNMIRYYCRCDCGKEILVRRNNLTNEDTKSCGCLKKESSSLRMKKHGMTGSAQTQLLGNAKRRAKEEGVVCTLELADIKIPEKCPLLGCVLKQNKGKRGAGSTSPSLDRIIPELGYIPSNVWVISHRANTIKTDASLEELKLLTANLEKKLKEMEHFS